MGKNNLLHATKTIQSIYFISLYIFNYIPKQKKYLREKIKISEAFHHAVVDPRPTKEACFWLMPVLVASPAIAIDKRQTAKKKSKVGTPVAINYSENKCHA